MLRVVRPPEGLHDGLSALDRNSILSRIWAHDHTVWKPSPAEIANRLGWLHAPFQMVHEADRIASFAEAVRSDGFRHVLLLGMGGSSLAPEALARTFGAAPGYPELLVLDSTHPDAVSAVERRLDLDSTLVLVATKSGTTVETLSLFRHFHRRISALSGEPGLRFVAITDPGSPLVEIADSSGFRETFLNDPNLGGRYSALSLFGLVPAGLLGIDVASFLDRARRISIECAKHDDLSANPAVRLGAVLGASALAGRDKLTIAASPAIAGLADWIEQLIAESTGKEGTGIVPIVGEPIRDPSFYASDRLFVSIATSAEVSDQDPLAAHADAGHPVVEVVLDTPDALADQFFLWELATAIAGHILGVNPFDQPNVEAAKRRARETVDAYRASGTLPPISAEPYSMSAVLDALRRMDTGREDYVALHGYLPPSAEWSAFAAALRERISTTFGAATTFGYGPRFLHSTGQLHQGGRGNGRFIQLIFPTSQDIPIPDSQHGEEPSMTFGTLIASQALGDRRALRDAGRPVRSFELQTGPTSSYDEAHEGG